MFGFLKKKLKKIYNTFTSKVHSLFTRATVDEGTLKELETLLIAADAGITTTKKIIEQLRKQILNGTIKEGQDLHKALAQQLNQMLDAKPFEKKSDIFLLVGINGSGKTTFAAKEYKNNRIGKAPRVTHCKTIY